jgi:hypothetical protein
MKTSVPGRRYAFGSLTAWLRPDMNSLAVSIAIAPDGI